MTFVKTTASVLAVAAVSASAAAAQDREPIQIVGSSTVFPFATAVVERFGRTTDYPTPVIDATGSGGGLQLFCEGVGSDTPDFTNASRRIEPGELETCMSNGVESVTEVMVGYDGIVVANAESGPRYELSRGDIWTALAAEGPMPTTWDEVNPALPAEDIEVFGPPPTSGTYDAFQELVMVPGCEEAGGTDCEGAGAQFRTDGAYVEAGEQDNLIVSSLEENDAALGIFGFSFLDQNRDTIRGAMIDGVEPTFENIASGEYPVSRSLFFYMKNAHVGTISGMKEYAMEFVSDEANGEGGYLVDLGLIPLDQSQLEEMRSRIENQEPLTVEQLEG